MAAELPSFGQLFLAEEGTRIPVVAERVVLWHSLGEQFGSEAPMQQQTAAMNFKRTTAAKTFTHSSECALLYDGYPLARPGAEHCVKNLGMNSSAFQGNVCIRLSCFTPRPNPFKGYRTPHFIDIHC